jgi:hypothetical protein
MKKSTLLSTAGALLALLTIPAAVAASPQGYEDRYRKIEYMIPMRDGVKLYTAVYVPKDGTEKHPIIMERTPYSCIVYGPDSSAVSVRDRKFLEANYIVVLQDVRGQYMSEGKFVNVRPELKPGETGIDESTDTYDTVDYLVKHVPNNNGAVGLIGISYPGFYAGVGAINSHPALKAVSPQAPVSDWFLGDDWHRNGAFMLQDGFDFSAWFDFPRSGPENSHAGLSIDRHDKSAYDFFLSGVSAAGLDDAYLHGRIPYWKELTEHPNYDAYWKDRALPPHMKNVKCAVLTVGGWFDAEDMWGALHVYEATGRQNKGTPNFLVMGPWYHGMWYDDPGRSLGDVDFGQNTGQWYRDHVQFPFFERYLHGVDVPPPAGATVFETGSNRWLTFPHWPPDRLSKLTLYMAPGKALAPAKPSEQGLDSYVYDPASPTPYIADYATSTKRPVTYMVDDQRFAEKRPDVLSFVGPVERDDVTLAGPVDVDLWVSTTGTDADLVVKVIDVWPSDSVATSFRGKSMAGYEQLVRADVFRGRFRNSMETPEPFKPGEPTRVHFKLNDLLHTVRKGHRIMVQVQSAWFPLVDRNPNAFVDIYNAKAGDYHKASISIYSGAAEASSISFGILPEQ